VPRKVRKAVSNRECTEVCSECVLRFTITVKRHLHNTYHKMELGSRGEAVRQALLNEWSTISEITDDEEEEKEE
jgi:hypothetical protein